ncbi:hypothetical protein HYQ46_005415 [Verticillium longisporum]|nr:hypothetical protein HYQ46_005415 [Verticillium longisporum]
MRSKRHHAIARRTKRRALVVVEPEARPEARPEKEAEVAIAAESRDSSPEIGLSAFGLPAPVFALDMWLLLPALFVFVCRL